MAKNEPNKPDDVKTMPETEQTTPITEVLAPKMSAEEAVTLAHEVEAALHDIGDDGLEPPAPFDIPAPGDVVVLAVVLIGGGAGYYFKIYRPKHQGAESEDDFDYGNESGIDDAEDAEQDDELPPWVAPEMDTCAICGKSFVRDGKRADC